MPEALDKPDLNNHQFISFANRTTDINTSLARPADRLHWEKDGFYDSLERKAYFRGVNVAGNAKLPPFIPFDDPRWWDLLASWGFNAVRLTIFWEAIEPEPGIYNRSYLNKVREMADQASSRGIYIILDMHQDLYSRWLGGDGAPYWALYNDTRNDSSSSGCLWFLSYALSPDVRASSAHFFQSGYLRKHYSNAWAEVAGWVKDNQYILGYDIMNEPSGGDLPNDAGQFENGYLKPFYQQTLAAIRQVDPDAVGFTEPNVLDMYRSKLTPFDSGEMVYAPHLYSPISQNLLQNLFNPNNQNPAFKDLLAIHQKKAIELGMPLFIGEFGTPWTIKPAYKRDELVNRALESMEEEFVDNAYWDCSVRDVDIWNGEDFSLIDKNGQARGLKVNVRPYLRRLKGLSLSQSFNQTSRKYRLSFKDEAYKNGMDKASAAQAIIYVPARIQYPDGFLIKTSDGHFEYKSDSCELWYFSGQDGNHDIIIAPKEL